MVNLDKWEEISFGEIKRHDLVRCIVKQGNITKDIRGIVNSYDSRGVRNIDGILFALDPAKLRVVKGRTRTIYRRKPKPFEFPTNTGAVITGIWNRSASKERTTFVLVSEENWISSNSNIPYTVEELRNGATNFILKHEGATLD